MPAVKASHCLCRISLGEPCEIMPRAKLPIVSAVFHWASHAPRCPCGIRNADTRARHSVRAVGKSNLDRRAEDWPPYRFYPLCRRFQLPLELSFFDQIRRDLQ